MKKILIILIFSLSLTYSQGRFFGSSMDYSYKGIEWNGDTPFVEHIKDGYNTSKIYKDSIHQREWFDVNYIFELKNLTNETLNLCFKYNVRERDGMLLGTSTERFYLEPNEQKTLNYSMMIQYKGFSVSKSDWEIMFTKVIDVKTGSRFERQKSNWRRERVCDDNKKYGKKSGW